ncbi:hypothetical protein LOD99_707 [Oopsacas minuta]|uniref:EGF-like domain-containing protein n=1 Tax=Oopsacas minuta TaxID=111878 RepID=A0AAV7K0N3_9METZ|nr:hypothetical protein LOD99_707 [Oopsacas minuta]
MKPCCCRGEQRDTATDMCEPICTEGCQNNGVCTRPDICSCTPYWEGETCHLDVNECHNSPCEHDCRNLVPGFECSCKRGYKIHDTDPTLCTKHTVNVDKFSVESDSLTQARINWRLHSTFELSELLASIKITFCAENETSSISSMNPNQRSLTVIGLSPNTLYTFKMEIILHNTIPMEDRGNLTGIQTIRFHTPSMLMTKCLRYHNERQRELSMSIITHQLDPNPCNNNGECIDNDLRPFYTCKCPVGLTGHNCNELYDPCSESDCQNGGICTPTADRSNYTCTCPAMYTGAKCDVRISPCITDPNLCLNGAVCIDRSLTETGYECKCATGYIGRHCEVSYTYCDDRICLNNGECIHNTTSGESQCKCSLPYYGERCEITMEPCVDSISNPCQNNGLCYNYPTDIQLNEPFCACPSHAIGMHCESTCRDEGGGFCDCDTQGQCSVYNY